MQSLEIKYTCKILPFGIVASIAITVGIGMAILFTLISFNLPVIVTTVLMVVVMYACLYVISSEASFYLTNKELSRNLLSNNFLFKNQKEKTYTWQDVKAFKEGVDKGRYRGEYQFIDIKFKNGDQWKITDMYGERKEDYDLFVAYFRKQVNLFNEQIHNVVASEKTPTKKPTSSTFIKKEKTFYETLFGKIITLLIGVMILLLLTKGKPYLTSSAKMKLFIVLIPGFFYMFYRTFLQNKNNDN